MTIARPQNTRSSTAGILFDLASLLVSAEKELATHEGARVPAKFISRSAYIDARLAHLGVDLAEKTDFHAKRSAIQFDMALVESRSPTPPTQQIINMHKNQLNKLQPEVSALEESYKKLEAEFKDLQKTIWTSFKNLYSKIQSASNPDDMLRSQVVQSQLQTMEDQIQRFRNNLSSSIRISKDLENKFDMVQATITSLKIGTEAAAGRTAAMPQAAGPTLHE
jgi:small-conductance mechanosensitive channel